MIDGQVSFVSESINHLYDLISLERGSCHLYVNNKLYYQIKS